MKTFNNRNDIHISIQFRPGVESGLVFSLMNKDSDNNAWIIIYLKDGLVCIF